MKFIGYWATIRRKMEVGSYKIFVCPYINVITLIVSSKRKIHCGVPDG